MKLAVVEMAWSAMFNFESLYMLKLQKNVDLFISLHAILTNTVFRVSLILSPVCQYMPKT